jgi:lysophospholipase
LESVDTSVLLLGTSNDKLVSMRAIEEAAERLPAGELVRFGKEAQHEILRDTDAVRERAKAVIDEFLDRVAPQK